MNLLEVCLLCLWNTSWFNGLRLKIQCDKFILDFMTKKHFYISALALIMGGASVACSDDESTTYVTYQHPYSNPLTDYSAADPTVLKENDHSFYVYCTNTWQALHSADLVNWTKCDQNLFEKRPSFVTGSGVSVWAPDIEKIGDKYVLYYAMSAMGKPENAAIGTAYSDSPQGPFKLDKSRDGKGLLFTSKEIDVRNSIDPCFFEEDGKKWLFWGSFNGIYAVQLSDDGMNVLNGDLEAAKKNKVKIAGTAFEAPYICKRGDYYYMFASVGACCNAMLSTYTTVVGRSTSLLGPYVSKSGVSMLDNGYDVVIRANDHFVGPGHNSEIVTDSEGNEFILYHSYNRMTPSKGRFLMLDRIFWSEDGWPLIKGDSPSSEAEAPVCK